LLLPGLDHLGAEFEGEAALGHGHLAADGEEPADAGIAVSLEVADRVMKKKRRVKKLKKKKKNK